MLQRWTIENEWHLVSDNQLGEDARRSANRLGKPLSSCRRAEFAHDIHRMLALGVSLGDKSLATKLPDQTEQLALSVREALVCEQRYDWIGAAAGYAKASQLDPQDARLVTNLAHALWLADLPHPAEKCYRRAIQMESCSGTAWCGLANTLRDLNRFEEAAEAYARAAGSEAAWCLSQVMLGMEHYSEGFRLAENRKSLNFFNFHWPQPFWDQGRFHTLDPREDLWVWSEQGFGDTFQYLRWIPLLMETRHQQAIALDAPYPAELYLVVESNLVTLFREGLAWMSRPPHVLSKSKPAGPVPKNHGPMMSLPHLLGMVPDPHDSGPILRSPLWNPGGPSLFSGDLDDKGHRVGIVWASGRYLDKPYSHREYLKRSLPPGELWCLIEGLQSGGAQLVSLQYGEDTELASLLGFSLARPLLDLGAFSAVARVLAQLDLIITVDTAMAHLVGSMGMPAWILLPWSADSRWLRERSDSPWYPSLRLFRQPRTGDWHEAIDQVLKAYGELFSALPGC